MIKAAIFDLDGTLVHTDTRYRRNLMKGILERFGKSVPVEELDEFWFMHSRDLMVEKWGVDVRRFWKAYLEQNTHEKELAHTLAFDDAGYIRKLRENGIRLAVLTGSTREVSKKKLKLVDAEFDIVVNVHTFTDIKGKPHPDGALECLRLLGTKKEETIYVGNSDEDILTAKNAGIFSILIDRKEYKHDLKPDAKIDSLRELGRIISSR
jgi:HAD superfamily hydrolase (TIGR01509 family)